MHSRCIEDRVIISPDIKKQVSENERCRRFDMSDVNDHIEAFSIKIKSLQSEQPMFQVLDSQH